MGPLIPSGISCSSELDGLSQCFLGPWACEQYLSEKSGGAKHNP